MKGKFTISKKKLYEKVIDQFERFIITSGYKTGDKLPPLQELAEIFGVAKPTMREALCVLASFGAVEIVHGNGVFLRQYPFRVGDNFPASADEISYEQLLQWLEYRRAIEVEAAGLAAERRNENDLLAIEEAQRRLEEDIGAGRLPAEWDYQFHHGIILATHNPVFVQAAQNIAHILKRYFELSLKQSMALPGRRELVIREHRRILEQIRHCRSQEARKTMREHLVNVELKVRLLSNAAGEENGRIDGE